MRISHFMMLRLHRCFMSSRQLFFSKIAFVHYDELSNPTQIKISPGKCRRHPNHPTNYNAHKTFFHQCRRMNHFMALWLHRCYCLWCFKNEWMPVCFEIHLRVLKQWPSSFFNGAFGFRYQSNPDKSNIARQHEKTFDVVLFVKSPATPKPIDYKLYLVHYKRKSILEANNSR